MRQVYRACALVLVLTSWLLFLLCEVRAETPTPPTIPAVITGWTMHVDTSDKTITVAWDANTEPDLKEYEIVFYNLERETWFAQAKTTQTQITVTLKTGHYIAFVRAVDTSDNKSDWTSSHVGGSPGPWWIYRYLAPPGPIVIE